MNQYDIDPDELVSINSMFLAEELRESIEMGKSLRIRDNAEPMYQAIKQIKELIDQEPDHPRPYEVYQSIRDLANKTINKVEGWL